MTAPIALIHIGMELWLGFSGRAGNPHGSTSSRCFTLHTHTYSYLINCTNENVEIQLKLHTFTSFFIYGLVVYLASGAKKKEMAQLENHLELCPLTHTLTQTQSTCVGISACRLQTGILRGCVPAAPSPEAPPSPSTPPGLPQTDPRPPWGRC